MTLSLARASNDVVTLVPGGGSELTLARPFETVLIGNPDVVDVQPQGDRPVLLKGLNPGASNLVFLDERSIAIVNIKVNVSDSRT
jgi:Flp pilus assembly secretin CpaC